MSHITYASKTDAKNKAQDHIFAYVLFAWDTAIEEGDEPQEFIDQLERQARRIAKLFNYTSHPRLGDI